MTDRVPMPNAVSKTSTGATVTNVAEGRDPRALRAEPIPPQQLTPEQQPYYQLSKRQIEQQFSGASRLSAMADNGALLGAWSVWMGAPDLGTAFAALQGTISAFQALPPRVQQVITLLTAARQRAAYELAGHRIIALTQGFTASEADALTAGYAPSTLSPAEQLAASATQCLLAGGALPQPLYEDLLHTFGPHGPLQVCSVVGQYLFLAVTLNTFDVPA
jgi:4-carboxymuconolactone decarboxylase